jgi:hypothetical protein
MPASQHPASSGADAEWAIQLERHNRRAADRRQAQDLGSVVAPGEMCVPGLRARVVPWRRFLRLGILCLRLCAFQLITWAAWAPQVLTDGLPIGGNW